MSLIRVQKIIADAGFCSRRKAEQYIQRGKVTVNGKTITIGSKADPEKDVVKIGTIKMSFGGKRSYYALHKPKNVLCSLKKMDDRKIIKEFIPTKGMYNIGRLDYETEGLLFLTNDGDFANYITHPRYEVGKKYIVWLKKTLTPQMRKLLLDGIMIDRSRCAFDKVEYLSGPTHVEVTLHIGKNRIIRRMMQAVRNHVVRLVRIQIGTITLGNLKPGKLRKLTKKELQSLGYKK